MMRRLLVVLVLAGFLTTGCISSRRGRVVAIGSGLATVALGAAMWRELHDEPEGASGFSDDKLGCLFGGCLIAGGLMVAGSVLATMGLVVPGGEAVEPIEPLDPLAEAVIAAAAPVTTPAPWPIAPSLLRPLPEVATDDATLQLAKQTRSAALAANCPAVRVMLRDIAARDRRYHDALVAGPVIDGCR